MKKILSILFFILSNLSYATSYSEDISTSSTSTDTPLICVFITEQIQQIRELSKKIDAVHHLNNIANLNLYNERGFVFFSIGEFEKALEDFDYVLSKTDPRDSKKGELAGTALWGKLFCHAFNSQLEETSDTALQLQVLFTECKCPEENLRNNALVLNANFEGDFSILPIAKFAHPHEKISESECHDRVANIADKMRSLSDLIPLFVVREAVLITIDKLQQKGHCCCKRERDWTICLGPIADAWKKLDSSWDFLVDLFQKGTAIGKFLTGED